MYFSWPGFQQPVVFELQLVRRAAAFTCMAFRLAHNAHVQTPINKTPRAVCTNYFRLLAQSQNRGCAAFTNVTRIVFIFRQQWTTI